MLTRGELPPDELRCGPQDVLFATLKKLMPEHDEERIMWNQIARCVQHYEEFAINAVRRIFCISTFCYHHALRAHFIHTHFHNTCAVSMFYLSKRLLSPLMNDPFYAFQVLAMNEAELRLIPWTQQDGYA
jgi:hypothetical protein